MYDFSSYYDRRRNGSSKWLKMNALNESPKADVIPMTTADMDFPTCPAIIQAIQDYVATEVLGYSNATDSYLQSVQNFFKEMHHYTVEKEWIITTPGIVPALSTSVQAFTDENDGIIVMSPVYTPFYDVIRMQNRRIEECALLLQNNRYEIDFDSLASLAEKPDVKMLMLCSPHNPGGRIWTEAELQKIIDIALTYDLLIVSDEIHADIILDGHTHRVLPTVDKRIEDQSIICTAASKTFNIAGLQCSNIFISNPILRQQFIDANLALGIERANVLGMVATEAAYNDCRDWLEEMKQVIETNQDLVTDFFESLSPKFKVMKQEASFLAWIDYEELAIDDQTFNDFLIHDCDFYINSGEMYGEASRYFFRINVGLPTEKLKENLDRFKIGMEQRFMTALSV